IRAHPVAAGFTITYVVAFGVFCVPRGISAFWIYAGVVAVLMVLVAVVDRRIGLSPRLVAALSVWGLAHMAGGLIPAEAADGNVLYNVVLIPGLLRYDQLVHALGFGTAAAVCRRLLEVRAPGLRPGTLAICVWLMGMGLGAFNEVVEFATTLVQPQSNVGGYRNTAFDLVFNMLGSGAVALWAGRREAAAYHAPP
ncbi:MAG: DUF2238 domain-containing protein, partial [Nocardioidaceae bacterium]